MSPPLLTIPPNRSRARPRRLFLRSREGEHTPSWAALGTGLVEPPPLSRGGLFLSPPPGTDPNDGSPLHRAFSSRPGPPPVPQHAGGAPPRSERNFRGTELPATDLKARRLVKPANQQAYYQRLLDAYPQKENARFIQPEEVAELIWHPAQQPATPITGACLSIDFGLTAGT